MNNSCNLKCNKDNAIKYISFYVIPYSFHQCNIPVLKNVMMELFSKDLLLKVSVSHKLHK